MSPVSPAWFARVRRASEHDCGEMVNTNRFPWNNPRLTCWRGVDKSAPHCAARFRQSRLSPFRFFDAFSIGAPAARRSAPVASSGDSARFARNSSAAILASALISLSRASISHPSTPCAASRGVLGPAQQYVACLVMHAPSAAMESREGHSRGAPTRDLRSLPSPASLVPSRSGAP